MSRCRDPTNSGINIDKLHSNEVMNEKNRLKLTALRATTLPADNMVGESGEFELRFKESKD
jgi:hypothetical protein